MSKTPVKKTPAGLLPLLSPSRLRRTRAAVEEEEHHDHVTNLKRPVQMFCVSACMMYLGGGGVMHRRSGTTMDGVVHRRSGTTSVVVVWSIAGTEYIVWIWWCGASLERNT